MLRSLTPLVILFLLFSCGDSASDPKVVAEATPPAPETTLEVDVEEVPAAPTVQKDQIKQTVKAAPEVINAAKLLEGAPPPTASIQGKTVTPSQPAPKATKPAATTASTSPAPSAPVSAPAPAPKKETAPVTPPAAPAAPATPTAAAPTTAPAPPAAPAKPDHAAFNALLGKHVNSRGDVNYAAFKKDEAKLDAYIAELSENSPGNDWGRKESMAFWINAYNANTIKLILKKYPVKSITDLDGGKPWDVKWIKIGSKTYSLNNIEHDIIRPRYKDARIHFAVNCAAASCPPLPNKAFTAANLNSLLESRTRSFVRNSKYNTINDDAVKVSKIFDWYGEDFGDLREYLNKYAATEIPEGTEIGFAEYDWALNKQ
jgi:hypothetical protein